MSVGATFWPRLGKTRYQVLAAMIVIRNDEAGTKKPRAMNENNWFAMHHFIESPHAFFKVHQAQRLPEGLGKD
jgi:hypothetical protein